MHPLISDAQFNTIGLIVVAAISIIPTTLAAIWAKSAKQNSVDASVSAAAANAHAAGALHEVKANGGMSDPDPTLKDYIKYVGEIVERDDRRLDKIETLFEDHLRHSKLMDEVLAKVFFAVRPDLKDSESDDEDDDAKINRNGERDFT